jgi:hypothetical protein
MFRIVPAVGLALAQLGLVVRDRLLVEAGAARWSA